MIRKNNSLFLPDLCTTVAKNCALLIIIFCALLLTDYSNVRIENNSEFKNKIDNIIDVLRSDHSIKNELKQQAISDFQDAKNELGQNGKLPKKIMDNILQYGSEISSIGSLVLQLLGT